MSYPESESASIAITKKPLSVTAAFSQENPVIVSIYLSAPITSVLPPPQEKAIMIVIKNKIFFMLLMI
nr:MAG TPA: hypothetical protein [Caudoviricetes sp.]